MKAIHALILHASALALIPAPTHAQSGQSTKTNYQKKEIMISPVETNKAVVRKLYEQALNKRNLPLLSELIAANYVGIRGAKGPEAFMEPVAVLIKAFPDIQWSLLEVMGEGNKVYVRWKVQGTHTAQFQNIPATGKSVNSDGMAVYELIDGKIVSGQVFTDRFGFLQQLGVLPADIAALSSRQAHPEYIRFIDKFLVPAAAREEFMTRVRVNQNFIKTLPGFVEDAAYERVDEQGNLVYITMAVWKNEDALKHAKEAVQAAYKQEGFNPADMFERLHITMDRGQYKEDRSSL